MFAVKERREKLAGSWKGRWDQDLLKEEIFFKNTISFFYFKMEEIAACSYAG